MIGKLARTFTWIILFAACVATVQLSQLHDWSGRDVILIVFVWSALFVWIDGKIDRKIGRWPRSER